MNGAGNDQAGKRYAYEQAAENRCRDEETGGPQGIFPYVDARTGARRGLCSLQFQQAACDLTIITCRVRGRHHRRGDETEDRCTWKRCHDHPLPLVRWVADAVCCRDPLCVHVASITGSAIVLVEETFGVESAGRSHDAGENRQGN